MAKYKSPKKDWAVKWAKDFHETYERLAPEFGYKTRKESAKPWSEVPLKNRSLMIAVCAEVLCRFETRHQQDPVKENDFEIGSS